MFGVTADNKRGCDSSELHILYLSKIARENQKQQWSKIVPGNDMFVMSDSFGKVWNVHSQIKFPLTLMVINSAPSVTPKVFLLEFSTKSTSRQCVYIIYLYFYILCISCWGLPPIFVDSVTNAARYHHSHCIIQLESHQQLLKPCSIGLTFKAAEISSWKVGFIHR